MIKINTQSTIIPIHIGALQFCFDISDESVKKIESNYIDFVKKLEGAEEENETTLKSLLEEGFDLFLGSGSFNLIYEQTPSYVICLDYLCTLTEALGEEIRVKAPRATQMDAAAEYLKKKNKK